MANQTPVRFSNRNGLRLFGVLQTPPSGVSSDLSVILLSPGVKMRVGPQGLYRRISDQLVDLGLTVLRVDSHGLGDSEGTLTEELLRDVYNHIQVGRFVNDTIDAMDWMQKHCGTKRFILSGLCGGAVTGLLAGSRDGRVAGLLALGITPVLSSHAADVARYMTTSQLRQARRGYIRRLLRPRSWLRLLTLKSDYRLIWRFVHEPLWHRFTGKDSTGSAVPSTEPDDANPLFPPAFFSMLSSKRPMLMIFGGADRLQWEFDEKFVARHKDKLAALPALCDVHIVQHANHVLSFSEWQNEMLKVSGQWLHKHFTSDLSAAQAVVRAHR